VRRFGILLITAVAVTPGATAMAAPTPDTAASDAAVASRPAGGADGIALLRQQLAALFTQPALAQEKVSAVVMDLESGETLYAHNDQTLLNTASNVKIVTSAAALSLLGPAYRWRTTIHGPTEHKSGWPAQGGTLHGDLYLRGSGDPTLATEDLVQMASELEALGLRRVRGTLFVDASLFDDRWIPPAFEQKDESHAFRAPSSAASLNHNAVTITVVPAAQAGAAARVIVDSASPYFIVTGQVTTTRGGPAVPQVRTADTGFGTTEIAVEGNMRLGDEAQTFERRVVHPGLFLGHTFRRILERYGIVLRKPPELGQLPDKGYRALAGHASQALAIVVHDLNKKSRNFTAEQVIRTLGAKVINTPGTWEKGLEAVARYLESIGIPRATYRMDNGSGLYDSNRFSAYQIATVLRASLRDFRIGSEMLASLAVAGSDGTLGHRMKGTAAERYVRAKTGTLATVSCLSGVVGAADQRSLVFSILMNDVQNQQRARSLQDRAAAILASYLDRSPARGSAKAL
jgi:D-alanyl-D-alanine carboxypeptidase/D-alanyl-D-alanine-endopeptidase (penicillin-binding protein 4)